MFLYAANNDHNAIRHLIPELGLLIAVIGVEKNVKKKIYIGSFILGLSLLSSIEYAFAANLTFVIYLIFKTVFNKLGQNKLKEFLRPLFWPVLFFAGYGLFLFATGTIKTFIQLHLEDVKTFYYSSPCTDIFPRLADFGQIFKHGYSNNPFFSLFHFLSQLNYYGVFIILFILSLSLFYLRKTKYFFFLLPLVIYSYIIQFRTLNTPCHVYYGVTFILFIPCFLLFKNTPEISKKIKYILIGILLWLILSSGYQGRIKFILENHLVKKLFSYNINKSEISGVLLNKNLVSQYKEVTEYIQKNTGKNDSIFVFPNGPYTLLTMRKSTVNFSTSWYYETDKYLVEPNLDRLMHHPPKLVIINIHNSHSMKSSLNGIAYGVYDSQGRVIIDGLNTDIENFIMSNYHIVKKNKVAWILEFSDNHDLQKRYVKIPSNNIQVILSKKLHQRVNPLDRQKAEFDVDEGAPTLALASDQFNETNLVIIPMKISLGLIKPISKFVLRVYLTTEPKAAYLVKTQFIAGEWQDIWVYIPRHKKDIKIKSIQLQVSPNLGFLPWGKPDRWELELPKSYILNPNISVTERANIQ